MFEQEDRRGWVAQCYQRRLGGRVPELAVHFLKRCLAHNQKKGEVRNAFPFFLMLRGKPMVGWCRSAMVCLVAVAGALSGCVAVQPPLHSQTIDPLGGFEYRAPQSERAGAVGAAP